MKRFSFFFFSFSLFSILAFSATVNSSLISVPTTNSAIVAKPSVDIALPSASPLADSLITEIDTDTPIAILSLSSFSSAISSLETGLSSAGLNDSMASIQSVLDWLLMIPSLDFIDSDAPITSCLLPLEGVFNIPDRTAVFPLARYGGEFRLRSTLSQHFKEVKGVNVLSCSGALSPNSTTDPLYVAIAQDKILAASSPNALRWLAQNHRNKSVPSASPVRKDAPISISILAQPSAQFLSLLLPHDAETSLPPPLNRLPLFRDFLQSLSSLDFSFLPKTLSWNIATRLEYPPPTPSSPIQRLLQAPTPSHVSPAIFHSDDTFCRSVSLLPTFCNELLPNSFSARFGTLTPFAPFNAFHFLPGIPFANSSSLFKCVHGERAAAFLATPSNNRIGKIEIYPLKKSESETINAIQQTIQNAAQQNNSLVLSPTRPLNSTQIFGYEFSPPKDDHPSDTLFFSQSLSLIFQLQKVEITVKNNMLFVASGPMGLIEEWLSQPSLLQKKQSLSSLAPSFSSLPPNETLLGIGVFEPSRTIHAAFSFRPSLKKLERQLPHAGNGVFWRLSRSQSSLFFEIEAASSEILAIQALQNLDLKELGEVILNLTLNNH